MSHKQSQIEARDLDIAVIGMAGRFPGAANIEEFWRNLAEGVESISFPSDDELTRMGVPLATMRHPRFVRAAPLLHDVDRFDANLFGYSPREAELIDPQHRLFLECAWESLESAGYQSDKHDGLIGVYAGTSLSSYLLYNLLPTMTDIHSEESLEMMIGNDKDFLSTRVAYKLNLKGPALTVQTGCSTSLVAVHLACQALLNYQCDMALAGGVSVHVPQRTGYYYQENGINSPDGHCRAFDARGQGTLFGSGVGIVVLKRLADALDHGDCIHAVIQGSAINNDGSQKVGFTAPSVEGQSNVILAAQALAGVEPGSITYVECHGTATALGDPVEFHALANAFASGTSRKRFCALASVKSNIGHLDAAAGVAGLVKTILALKHRRLPPSIHFESPNPKIDLEDSPFYVNRALSEWRNGSGPLRAAVSSFGIGGTNAHVILEEAPAIEPSGPSRDFQLLVLSARTSSALDTATGNLADHLKQHPETSFADTAFTLAVGRKNLLFRRVAVCAGIDDAISALETQDPARVFTLQHDLTVPPIAFMFAGGGAQYCNMGLDLYRHEPLFRQEVDLCSEMLREQAGFDVREYLFPDPDQLKGASSLMKKPLVGLSALFITQYALAKLWMSWGIMPQALIGHSLGEYTAATLAGVFSLEDALGLVVTRSRLLEQLPSGAMAAVPLSEKELLPLLGAHLSLAAINGEEQCVVSGPKNEIESLMASLAQQEVECRMVQVETASHSPMVEPILGQFRDFLKTVRFYPPQMPYISNVSGTWIKPGEATGYKYWVQHLRRPVLFGSGIKELLKSPQQVLLEVGPGHTLSSIAKLHIAAGSSQVALPSMRHPYDRQSDVKFLLSTLGRLWLKGVQVDWQGFYKGQRRLRIVLPAYPFERARHWIQPGSNYPGKQAGLEKVGNVDEWFYAPSWRQVTLSLPPSTERTDECWLILGAEHEMTLPVITALQKKTAKTIMVAAGAEFSKINTTEYTINPSSAVDYTRVFAELRADGIELHNILHLWSLGIADQCSTKSVFEREQENGLQSLLYMAQALAQEFRDCPVRIWTVSTGVHRIESTDEIMPEKATAIAACTVIPQEYPNISCRSIDIDVKTTTPGEAAAQILRELEIVDAEMVAYRGQQRWVRMFERIQLEQPKEVDRYFENGIYLITGGLGGIGLQLAGCLAGIKGTKIALISRSVFPEPGKWNAWLKDHPNDDSISRKIRALRALEAKGAELMVLPADVGDFAQTQSVVGKVQERWGEITGVMHLAGITGDVAMNLIADLGREELERHFRAKVQAVQVLQATLAPMVPRFCILFSSTASLLGGIGTVAYSAANLFMDAFSQRAKSKHGTRWLSVNWDGWLLEGHEKLYSSMQTSLERYAMTPAESWEAFCRIVAFAPPGQTIVSTGDLAKRMRLWVMREAQANPEAADAGDLSGQAHARPSLGTTYAPPTNELEATVLTIWQRMLGIEKVGIYDNFFELGGNSLIGIRMMNALKKALNLELPIIVLFRAPTVTALCELIMQKEHATYSFEESHERGQRRRESSMREAAIGG